MTIAVVLTFLAGVALLLGGAELLVEGASSLARLAGLTPLVVGLTVVAFGTSAPEAAVSVISAHSGAADIAFGNVVGSNIFNILVILGASSLVAPLMVHRKLLRVDVPILIACSIGLALMAWDGRIGRPEGIILLAGLGAYVLFSVRRARIDTSAEAAAALIAAGGKPVAPAEHPEDAGRSRTQRQVRAITGLVIGLGLLVWGSKWMVDGATEFARFLGVSELIIALTIVAAGTGLPEVATSLIAVRKGERDIAVGNAIGSCIFNILFVMGLAGLTAPDGIAAATEARYFDVPVMVATTIVCLPIFFSGYRISRWEGLLLLGYYAAYVFYLFLQSAQHDMLPAFSWTMAAFVLPLTVGVLVVLAGWTLVRNRKSSA